MFVLGIKLPSSALMFHSSLPLWHSPLDKQRLGITTCSGWIWGREPLCSSLSLWALWDLCASLLRGYSLVSLAHEEFAYVGSSPKERSKLSMAAFGRVCLIQGPLWPHTWGRPSKPTLNNYYSLHLFGVWILQKVIVDTPKSSTVWKLFQKIFIPRQYQ